MSHATSAGYLCTLLLFSDAKSIGMSHMTGDGQHSDGSSGTSRSIAAAYLKT